MRRGTRDLGLPFDSEGVGQADEIIEDADDVRRHDDGFFTPALSAQPLDVLVDDLVRSERELLGVFEQSAMSGLDPRRAKVGLDLLDELGIGVFETEKLSVNLRSIPTPAGARCHHRDHLALLARQRSLLPHDLLEELHEGTGVARVRGEKAAHLRRKLRIRVGKADTARRRDLGGVPHRFFDRIDA
jgi:hypothetical protein